MFELSILSFFTSKNLGFIDLIRAGTDHDVQRPEYPEAGGLQIRFGIFFILNAASVYYISVSAGWLTYGGVRGALIQIYRLSQNMIHDLLKTSSAAP